MTYEQAKTESRKMIASYRCGRSFGKDADPEELAWEILVTRLKIAEKIADALLVFEQNAYVGTPATRELMCLVRDFKGIL